jgi:aconitate hydratase
VNLKDAKSSFETALPTLSKRAAGVPAPTNGLKDGDVVISAITSCTNTSNPSVLIQAGLLAKKAVEKGLRSKPWVKTSLAPGSKVVADYLNDAGLMSALETLGFYLVGYGCTTCIGNSGPLPESVEKEVKQKELVVASVLSGNRNFEGRVHPLVRANYLMSPPLVVAYAIAGSMSVNLTAEPLGMGKDGKPVYLKDIWPTPEDVSKTISSCIKRELFEKEYGRVFDGDEKWKAVPVPEGNRFKWDEDSTYVRRADFLTKLPKSPKPVSDIKGARVLALLGDSVTTDHISPAGSIAEKSPAGQYLMANGVSKADFNSYGARRGNHEVMVRGTFANVRLKNLLAPGTEGGVTTKFPEGNVTSIYEASMAYQKEGVPLIIVAGKEYGSGSSRDWAAKGPAMLGVKAVIAESFERIHRSNLVMMGVLPLQLPDGKTAASIGVKGDEVFEIQGISSGLEPLKVVRVKAVGKGGTLEFNAVLRIDTPKEVEYYQHGGILPYVVRQLVK